MKRQERWLNASSRFQLGGLIVKAGLSNEEPMVLFGMLMSAKRVLSSQTGVEARLRWKALGESALESG
jgi:hypothetical protein